MRTHIIVSVLATALLAAPAGGQTLNVATAGDENMVDYVRDYLGPLFEKAHRGVHVVSVGTGPGDAGSQKIYEKLVAQKSAGVAAWDFDVIVIHQKIAGQMAAEQLLTKYKDDIDTGKLVTRETAANALGADVYGYVMPMFHSQTALAYNPDIVKDIPGSYAGLVEWVKKNPKKFGYNGIKGGMSGVAFVTGWVYAFSGNADRMIKGPYDGATKAAWDNLLARLKDFNRSVVITPGNAGTLDMLNRGEIASRTGVGRHVLHLDGGRQAAALDEAQAHHARDAGPADVLRGAGESRQCQACRGLRRDGDQSRGAGGRHRQALQLVSGHRCQVPRRQARPGGLEQALRRHFAGRACQQGPAVPDHALLQRRSRIIREAGRELMPD